MLAVMYLERGPPIAENETTTHRTHRTHRRHADFAAYIYIYIYIYIFIYIYWYTKILTHSSIHESQYIQYISLRSLSEKHKYSGHSLNVALPCVLVSMNSWTKNKTNDKT
jgi:hypothetical protein